MEMTLKGVIAWIQKVPNNDQLSLVVTLSGAENWQEKYAYRDI
jgi:hypothetical protein